MKLKMKTRIEKEFFYFRLSSGPRKIKKTHHRNFAFLFPTSLAWEQLA